MAVEYYNTGVGWGGLYGGTGASAGYDPSAYYLYGAPTGYEDYQQANNAYGMAAAKRDAANQLKQLLSSQDGRDWLQDHPAERDQLAETLGYDKDMLWGASGQAFGRSSRDLEGITQRLDRDIGGLNDAAKAAEDARNTAKGAMNDPFQAEVDRQMGLANDYRSQATDAQGRSAVQMDRTAFDQDRARELQARQGMLQTEGTLRD